MKAILTAIILALLLTPAITMGGEVKQKILDLEPSSSIVTETGHLIHVFDEGVAVSNPKLDCGLAKDCLGFCGKVCGTGQVDTCFCGGQSFPCEGIGDPPVCEVPIKK